MTVAALALIVAAAFLHAGWNLLAKQAGGGAVFLWMFAGCSSLIYAPFVLIWVLLYPPQMSALAWGFVGLSACIHLGYFLSLQRGYRVGDLSLVYPLARGTGPLIAALVAIALLGERPSALALAGGALIILCVFVLSGGLGGLRRRPPKVAVGYGLLTGLLIGGYSVVDKYAVSVLLVSPLLYDWLGNLIRTLLITPHALRRRDVIRTHWRDHRRAVLGIAIMSPLAYILVLTAMVFTPLSHIAPAREVSILIATILGVRVLSEPLGWSRLLAAFGMVLGLAALVVG